jgi:hypothetical protein
MPRRQVFDGHAIASLAADAEGDRSLVFLTPNAKRSFTCLRANVSLIRSVTHLLSRDRLAVCKPRMRPDPRRPISSPLYPRHAY